VRLGIIVQTVSERPVLLIPTKTEKRQASASNAPFALLGRLPLSLAVGHPMAHVSDPL
jgi:hypothetical protein